MGRSGSRTAGNNTIGRLDTRRDARPLHGRRRRAGRGGSRPGRTRRSGSPTVATTRSAGSPPTARSGSSTTSEISDPVGITRGPDGALWFTNYGNDTIGRITTAGAVDELRRQGDPAADRDHPRARQGALVREQRQQLDRPDHAPTASSRIFRRTADQPPARHHARPRRGALVHQPGSLVPEAAQEPDRPHHDHRRASRSYPAKGLKGAVRDHHRAGTRRSGSRARRRHTIGRDHDRRRRHAPTPAASRPAGHRRGPATAPSGSPARRQRTRSGGSRTNGSISTYTGSASDPAGPCGITAGPDGALWFTNTSTEQLDRADHHRRRRSASTPTQHRLAAGDRGRARRGALVHQRRRRLDRADHAPSAASALHRRSRSIGRGGSRPGPTARSGSPTATSDSIGRITTDGNDQRRTRDPSISGAEGDHGRARRRPLVHQRRQRLDRADHDQRRDHAPTATRASTSRGGIAAGPDGALWFTNHDRRLDRADHAPTARSRSYRDPRHRRAGGITAGPRRRPLVHQRRQRLDRADQRPPASISSYTRPQHRWPGGIAARTRRRPLVHQRPRRLDRADHPQRRLQLLRRHGDVSDSRHAHRHRAAGAVTGDPRCGSAAVVSNRGARRSS